MTKEELFKNINNWVNRSFEENYNKIKENGIVNINTANISKYMG